MKLAFLDESNGYMLKPVLMYVRVVSHFWL